MISHAHAIPLARMLVSIDALFDTRLGTIGSFGAEAYAQVLASNYGGRNSDHFVGIDPNEYWKRYQERGAHTLALSMTTHVVSLVKDFCARVRVTSDSSPIKATPRVDLNIWPYKMPDRIAEKLIKHLAAAVGEDAKFDFVNYSPEDLHYDLVKHTYDHAIFYDIGEWFTAQAEDWEKRNRCHNELTVFFPMLKLTRNPLDVPEDITGEADEINRILGTVFNPLQIPIQFFCSAFNATALAMTPGAEAPSATGENA